MGMLISLGESELQDMIDNDHGAEITCHFCNEQFRVSEEELVILKSAAGAPIE
jgi:molecular chaperone Hsp33